MKVIIEEGDVGELAPGVYDVEITSMGTETNFWSVGSYKEGQVMFNKMCLGINIDLDQKPNETLTRLIVRQLVQNVVSNVLADQHVTTDAAVPGADQHVVVTRAEAEELKNKWQATYPQMVAHFTNNATTSRLPPMNLAWVHLQVGGKKMRLSVGDVIEEPAAGISWTITGFPTAKTWSCTSSSLGGQAYTTDLDLLANDLASGKKVVRQQGTTTTTTTTTTTPKVDELVVGTQLKWAGDSNIYTVSKIDKASDRDKDIIELSWPTGSTTYTRRGLMSLIAQGQVSITTATCDKSLADCTKHGNKLNYGGSQVGTYSCPHVFGSKTCGVGWPKPAPFGCAAGEPPPFVMPERLPEATLDEQLAGIGDCDECFGTGLYKGFGGPCSKGCTGGGR